MRSRKLLEIVVALAARAAARRLGQPVARLAAEQVGRPGCCSRTACCTSCSTRSRWSPSTPRRCFAPRPTSSSAACCWPARSSRRCRPTCRSRRPPTRSRWSACSRWRACSSRSPRWTSAPRSARMGARREMLIGFLAEPALLMVLFSASLISQVDLARPPSSRRSAHRELAIYPSLAFAGVAFTMVSLAENARVPVDNPTTHLELTMIHEALILEYSGRHLALLEWAASLKLFAYSCIGARPVLPVGRGRGRMRRSRCCWRCRCWSSSSPVGGVAARADRDRQRQDAHLPRARVPRPPRSCSR